MDKGFFTKEKQLFLYGLAWIGVMIWSGCAGGALVPNPAPTGVPPQSVATRPAGDLPSTDPIPSPTTAGPATQPTPLNQAQAGVAEGDGLTHETIFTIRNNGRYSGEGGQPAWLGWGADRLSVAPDGSFWIADTPADPDRLLHYNTQGDLISVIPLHIDEKQYWARDIFADASGIWVLDVISQPGLLLHLDPNGVLLASYAIPNVFATYRQEDNEMPGLWNIRHAEEEGVLLDGPLGIVRLSLKEDGAVFEKLDNYPIGGRVYGETQDGFILDGQPLPVELIQPEHFLNSTSLLGVAPDGSFYVEEGEGYLDQGNAEPPDDFVRRYDSNGELAGIALLPIPEVYQRVGDVALGPDGNAYILLSYTDHSVEVQRLKFFPGPAPLLAPARMRPKTYFMPLYPSGQPSETDLDAAREAMLTFFTALANKEV